MNVSEKPWSVDDFEAYRPHMTQFVKSQVVKMLNELSETGMNKLLIHGQVKVGKREIVEYIAVRDSWGPPSRIHVFISAFHRKADESQRKELADHNISVFSVNSARRRDEAKAFIVDKLTTNPLLIIVIHWDECDYGTGYRQNLSDMFQTFKRDPRVFNILYSATPEEMLYSNELDSNGGQDDGFILDFYEKGLVINYDPPEGYCGAKKYLDEGLVFQALPWFECSGNRIVLMEQAKEILNEAKLYNENVTEEIAEALYGKRHEIKEALKNKDVERVKMIREEATSRFKRRNIISLRLSYLLNDDDDEDCARGDEDRCEKTSAFYAFLKSSQFVEELKDVHIIADKPDMKELMSLTNVTPQTIQWSKKAYFDGLPTEKIVLLVNLQTSTRSTEWACHDRVFAAHDYRKRRTFNTLAQAQLRPAHYCQNYGNAFQPIRIYGDVKTIQLSVGLITSAEYLEDAWVICKVSGSNPARYRIKHSDDTKTFKISMPPVNIMVAGEMVTYEGIPDPNGYAGDIAHKIIVKLGGTAKGNSKLSQRIKGKCAQERINICIFYPCEPRDLRETVAAIHGDQTTMFEGIIECDDANGDRIREEGIFPVSRFVGEHRFNIASVFVENTRMRCPITGESMYSSRVRGVSKILKFEQLQKEHHGESIRLTACYKDGQLGVGLRFPSGKKRDIDDMTSYKSMYQGDGDEDTV